MRAEVPSPSSPTKRTLARILDILRRTYGPRPPQIWGRCVDVLVETILSQNTSNANGEAGYRQLRRRFRSWKQVADAPVEDVERHIRVSGLSKQKAPRIQAILRQIRADDGKIDLQHLKDLDEHTAYDYLRRFPGVGPKTAHCTLLFAFGMAMFPVDTHMHRIALRLGLVPPKSSPEQTADLLTPLIAPADRYETHVLLIDHGRKTCRAINPKCDDCPLLRMCPTGNGRLQGHPVSRDAERSASGRAPLRVAANREHSRRNRSVRRRVRFSGRNRIDQDRAR